MQSSELKQSSLNSDDKTILTKLNNIISSTTKNLDNYRFGQASEDLYQFFWHDFCDQYIESTKSRISEALPTLIKVLTTSLQLLHPFIPFVTETIYQDLLEKYKITSDSQEHLLITCPWPKT